MLRRAARGALLPLAEAGVAASVAAILVLLALVALRAEKQSPPVQADNNEQAKPGAPVVPNNIGPKAPGNLRDNAVATPGSRQQARDNRVKNIPTPKRATQVAGRDSGSSRDGVQAVNGHSPMAGINEIATDFIPLMHGESFNQMDGGQIVRVELPRSALMSFGLPMNMERAEERIKADVVIGNDGLARAIRFVR